MNIYQRIAADEEFMLRRDDALSFCSQNHTTYYATCSIRHRYVWVTNKKKHRTGNLNAPSSTRVQFALYCKCISYNINTYTIYTYVHTRCTFTHIFSSHHWQYIVRRNLITFRILRCVCVSIAENMCAYEQCELNLLCQTFRTRNIYSIENSFNKMKLIYGLYTYRRTI